MLGQRYIARLRGLLDFMENDQLGTIHAAAEAVADRLVAGGALHIYDTGHLLNQELVHRAGGLLAMIPLQFGMSLNNPVSEKHAARKTHGPNLGLTDVALDASGLAAGDVLIVGSVSGRNPEVIDVALKAKERGALIVVLTSVTYSSQVESKHPSGKKLLDLGDFVLDNGSDLGDASLEVEGLPVKAVPTSGIGAAVAAWVLVAEVIECLVAKGSPPEVFASANLDWGPDFNAQARERFAKNGL